MLNVWMYEGESEVMELRRFRNEEQAMAFVRKFNTSMGHAVFPGHFIRKDDETPYAMIRDC